MTEDNLQRSYGYDHYTQSGQGAAHKRGIIEKLFGARMARRIKSPLFIGTALVITGAIFVSFMGSDSPDGYDQGDIPIVKADVMPFKVVPVDAGGMEIPNRESTVYSTMREASLDESAPVESLLGDQAEPMDKLAKFAAEVEANDAFISDTVSKEKVEAVEVRASAVESLIPAKTVKVEKASDTINKDKNFYDAGSSPETLAFVRSVLDRKDKKMTGGTRDITASLVPAKKQAPASVALVAAEDTGILNPVAAPRLAGIQPAAGVEAPRTSAPSPATYYVQLGSVTSEEGARSEWKRLMRSFSAELTGMDHRVKQADLGERGIYYRIQAGPMSREMASEMCSSIKAQKPGGCLVTR